MGILKEWMRFLLQSLGQSPTLFFSLVGQSSIQIDDILVFFVDIVRAFGVADDMELFDEFVVSLSLNFLNIGSVRVNVNGFVVAEFGGRHGEESSWRVGVGITR